MTVLYNQRSNTILFKAEAWNRSHRYLQPHEPVLVLGNGSGQALVMVLTADGLVGEVVRSGLTEERPCQKK